MGKNNKRRTQPLHMFDSNKTEAQISTTKKIDVLTSTQGFENHDTLAWNGIEEEK